VRDLLKMVNVAIEKENYEIFFGVMAAFTEGGENL
jgi:hypothetical protein